MNQQIQNSPKIYLIANNKGQFLNCEGKEPFFTSVLWKGSFGKNKIKVQETMELLGFENTTVFESTEKEYTEGLASETTNVCIQMDSIRRKLDRVNYHLPTISSLNKNLSNFLKNASLKLKEANPYFDDFVRIKEDATDDVVGDYEEFIEAVSKIELWEMKKYTNLINEFKEKSVA